MDRIFSKNLNTSNLGNFFLTLSVNKKHQVDISFRTKKLQKQCNCRKKCIKTFGPICADKIHARLDDLKDSPNLEFVRQFLPQARLHALHGDRKGQYALDLEHPNRLIIEPYHNPLPELSNGGIDLERITKVLVIEIKDYH